MGRTLGSTVSAVSCVIWGGFLFFRRYELKYLEWKSHNVCNLLLNSSGIKIYMQRAGFLNVSTVGLGNSSLCRALCCRTFSSVPGLCPPPVVTIRNVSRRCQMSPGRRVVPSWEPLIPRRRATEGERYLKTFRKGDETNKCRTVSVVDEHKCKCKGMLFTVLLNFL